MVPHLELRGEDENPAKNFLTHLLDSVKKEGRNGEEMVPHLDERGRVKPPPTKKRRKRDEKRDV